MNFSAALALAPNPPLLEVFGVGAAVLVGITLVHGSGLTSIVRSYRRSAKSLRLQARNPLWASVIFGRAIALMLILHLIDTAIWAGALGGLGLVQTFRNSLYLAASDYTTLGIATVAIGQGWRELGPVVAISGLFTFGWTTSVMFNVVGDYHNLLDELDEDFTKKLQMRSEMRAQMGKILHSDLAPQQTRKDLEETFHKEREAEHELDQSSDHRPNQ